MEPIKKSENKQNYTSFIPVRASNRGLEFYLQKRDMKPLNNPGLFGEFGGHIEQGENLLSSLERELHEELCYKPTHLVYFSKFEIANSVIHVFYEEVDNSFESRVTVMEGEYEKFLMLEEIDFSPEVSLLSQMIVRAVASHLGK